MALAANLLIAAAKAVGGLVAHSPALLSEAAHSVADTLNEVFLLAALRRSRRPADREHPFGYGKERFFWSLLAAVGIFVMGGCFSFFQGYEALRSGAEETTRGYVTGLVVLALAFLFEGASLLRAVHQVRKEGGFSREKLKDPALRTVVAEDGTAVLGVTLAMIGMALHMVTGQVAYEARPPSPSAPCWCTSPTGSAARPASSSSDRRPTPGRATGSRNCWPCSPRSTAWSRC